MGDRLMGGDNLARRAQRGSKSFGRLAWPIACWLCATSTALAFAANENTSPPPAKPSPPAPTWSLGSVRPFLSGRAIAGFGYGRLALTAGYGKPHWLWVGVEGLAMITPMYTSVQSGLHASGVIADLMVTVRRTYAFDHTLIPMAHSIGSDDLEQAHQPAAQSTALDASVWGFLPYGRWLVTWELTYVRPFGQDPSMLLYEEIQRAVVTREGVVTSKIGPMVNLSTAGQIYVGILAEHLSLLGRADPLVFRIGPNLWFQLSRKWNLYGYAAWPVHGPDHLGAWSGMYGAAGFLYRFATGESPSQVQ